MKASHSAALDLIGALERAARSDQEGTDRLLPPDPRLEEWRRRVRAEASPLLKADLDLLAGRVPFCLHVLADRVVRLGLDTSRALIDDLLGLSARDFGDTVLASLGIRPGDPAALDPEFLAERLLDEIGGATTEESDDQARLLAGLLADPGSFRDRLASLLENFREAFLPASEDEEAAAMPAILARYAEYLADGGDAFLDAVTMGHASRLFPDGTDGVVLYLSRWRDDDVTVSSRGRYVWMGPRAEELYLREDRARKAERLFGALSDPRRVEIVRLIARGRRYGNDLARHFGLTPATLSYHLSRLVNAGLVTGETGEGNRLYYSVNRAYLAACLDAVRDDLLA